ncbi:dynactin subunit 4 [Homalodisca vitripennis]|uniref:dynactin subunit 4 n=1 Tax=Homalodisca vitripennis TaxID=197043 RepID=UPI001EEC7F33|nr:dynactin subunit 4 [Homalodisca vitripennis]
MTSLDQPDYVLYACTCGCLKPVTRMYFCRHCLKVRCGYCVSHEVEAHFCSNCLENIPPSEARLKKNRCGTCMDCPNCLNALSVRATTISRLSEDGSKMPGKVYYLACFFCRWTTRDVGIPDQTAATGSWPERENPHANRINTLLEHYKTKALREKIEKERKTLSTPRRGYTHLAERYGLSGMIARRRAGLPTVPLGRDAELTTPPAPATASETVEDLPDHFFTQAPVLTQITTMTQRLALTDSQPVSTEDLIPPHRRLFIKRSQRCRECEHNICKPEFTPASIKFKIQLAAHYHLPSVRILTVEPLRAGQPCEIILKLTNPTQHLTSVQFCPLPTEQEELRDLELEIERLSRKEEIKPTSGRESLMLPSIGQRPSVPKPPRRVQATVTAVLALPSGGVILPPRDDAAEYDDSGDTHNFQDDPKVVVWRKGNKAAVRFTLTPDSTLAVGDPVLCGFVLCYGYVNTMVTVEPARVELQVRIYLAPGNVCGDPQ